jgi:4-phytase/acid phosphatase
MRKIAYLLSLMALSSAFWAEMGQARDIEYRMAVLAMRHGMRHPTSAPSAMSLLTQNRQWPVWYTTQLGCLTPNAVEAARRLGEYFRALFIGESLITDVNACPSDKTYYFRSDSYQRDWWTAQGITDGLFPNCKARIYAINAEAYAEQTPQEQGYLVCTSEIDPLFFPLEAGPRAPQMNADQALQAAAGTIGSASGVNTQALTQAYAKQIEILQSATDCCQPQACQNLPAGELCTLAKLQDNLTADGSSVTLNGPVAVGGVLADSFLMAYEDGQPLEDVAFGRLTLGELRPTFAVNNAAYDVMYNPLYVAQAQESNQMNQILLSLLQRASGERLPNAVALPSNKFVMFMSHDDCLHGLAGLMNASWINEGFLPGQTPPGSGFIFTLVRDRKSHRHFVRVEFVAQTPDQMRHLERLTLERPPSIAPLAIPGCKSPTDMPYYCALEQFSRLIRQSMNRKFITKVSSLRN